MATEGPSKGDGAVALVEGSKTLVAEDDFSWERSVDTVHETMKMVDKMNSLHVPEDLPIDFAASSNLFAIFDVVSEFYVDSCLAFNGPALVVWGLLNDANPVAADAVSIPYFDLPFDPNSFTAFFWGSIGMCVLFVVLSANAIESVRSGTFGLNADGEEVDPCKNPGHFVYQRFIETLGGTLYMPIIEKLIAILSCNYSTTPATLSEDGTFECWTGTHVGYIVAALLALLLYYPVSTFIFPNFQFADKSLDIKFNTTFVLLLAQVKMVCTGITVFFVDVVWIQSLYVLCFGFLSYLSYSMQPCIIKRLNVWRTASYGMTCILCSCTLIAHFANDTFVPGILGIVLCVLVAASASYRHYTKEMEIKRHADLEDDAFHSDARASEEARLEQEQPLMEPAVTASPSNTP